MLKYRSDIDGLRAIAVLLVVFYHVGLPVPGGFIGVDVFFVISGFLITSIISKEIRDEKFSFSDFYSRRAKRLLPPFIFMVIPVFIYCWYSLLPDDLTSFAKSALFSILGVSNFYFYYNTNYFNSTDIEPLLHTWSLAVEEQFYLFWPLVLIFLHKKKSLRLNLILLFFALISSISLSQYYVTNDKNLAYMMLPFRFFELMTGAVLALGHAHIKISNKILDATSIVGFSLIILSALFIDKNSPFPGLMALPVVIGSAIFIASYTENKIGFFNKILSNKMIVYIGKVSYSFYLWHWPIIALLKYQGFELKTINAIIIVLSAFLLACFSYHVVEQPFRKLNYRKFILPSIYVIPAFMIASLYFFINKNNGFENRFDNLLPELSEENTAHIIRSECMEKMKVGNYDECYLGVKKEIPDGILIGDSFGNAYSGFIDSLAKDANIMIHDTMKSSTPSIPGVYVSKYDATISKDDAERIIKYTKMRSELAKNSNIKYVILSDFFGQYDDKNKYYRVYNSKGVDVSEKAHDMRNEFINDLIKDGKMVYILARPFRGLTKNELHELIRLKIKRFNIDNIYFSYGDIKNSREEYMIEKEIKGVKIIDPNDAICNKNECSASIDGSILFRTDGYHLNYSSSKNLGNEYLKVHGNPFK
ncbi:putative acyltransferase protein membrane protein [Xenorhabdus bovienii str. oregonense]|uniref:Putative acyltransferase protein membrane protein n=1 Tax=Xenorhabdus bovienii str. oregonense TaxID=1398202 RepID=A0A077P3N7_XENBV|nr:acyltransferase family protein [Xenorhabdus bovienii]CDH05429.1 putative acyltransferase protein membrane protein [Xenorhabdus bovienii str. oregonense]